MKILIIKIGALGDVVRTSFIAQALKDKYKKLKPQIYWLTSKNATPLFINNPYVDFVISDSEYNREKLKKEKFDLVINLEEEKIYAELTLLGMKKEGFLFKENKIMPSDFSKEWFDMSLLGDKTPIKVKGKKMPKNDFLKINSRKPHRQLMGEIIGINWKKYEPFLRLNSFQNKIANDFKKRYNIKDEEIVLGLILGGADRWHKSLPIKLSVDLINKIYKKFKCKIILFGGKEETERNKKIISLSNAPIIDAGTGNNLVDFPALISVCNYVISTDSLGLHIALALKKKTICLIGPTQMYEKETFGHGKIIFAKSTCIGCMQRNCKSMEKMSVSEIIKALTDLLKKPSLDIIITAFKEPKTDRAVKAILNQKINYSFKLIVSAPDKKTQDIVKKYMKKNKNVELFKDPGKGKNFALNLLLKKLKGDILIFTDGDVFLSENSINEIVKIFNDSTTGCVAGRPVPEESKDTKYGYWANFLFDSAHKMREILDSKNDFLECSGYLFAFRNGVIDSFPLDTAEDTIIPYFFWEKGYKIRYSEKAKVYVKNVENWKDWISQKTRTTTPHDTIGKYVNIQITPKSKSFENEARGLIALFHYPNNIKEFIWSLNLMFARLYMWGKVFLKTRIKKQEHTDAWKKIKTAR